MLFMEKKTFNIHCILLFCQVIYCYVPKAACTAWKNTLAELTGIPPHADDDVHNKTTLWRYGFRLLDSVPLSEAKELMIKYKKFMFVRHPLSRLYSAYRDKFLGYEAFQGKYKDRYAQEIILRFRPQANHNDLSEGRVTFKEFVQYIMYKAQHGGMFNQHWRSPVDLCFPCGIRYDFIGKVETMDTDAMYVMREFFGQRRPDDLPLIHTKGSTEEMKEAYKNFTDEELRELMNVYKLDFEVFGYEMAVPWRLRVVNSLWPGDVI